MILGMSVPTFTLLHVLLSVLGILSTAATAGTDEVKVLNDDVHLAEGPVWYHGKLYYVEYDRS